MSEQIDDALSIAAEEITDRHRGFVDPASDERRHTRARTTLRRHLIRFLENVPEEMSALEIREALASISVGGNSAEED